MDTFPEIDILLTEPARLRLLTLLSMIRRAVFTFLLYQSGMTRGNLSVQMSRLSDANIVNVEKSFQGNRPRTVYELNEHGRAALRRYKAGMKEILGVLPD